MNPLEKQLWMMPAGPDGANVCNGAVDYVIPDVTGLVCVAAKPIALTERRPDEAEKSEKGECYYGRWDRSGTWEWVFVNMCPSWATHFSPAGVEVLPATCFNPTERENDRV